MARLTRPKAEEAEHLRDLYSRKWIPYEDLKRIERETGKVFKRGRFSKQETDLVLQAVDSYLRHKGLNREDFIDLMFVKNNEKSAVNADQCKDFFVDIAGKLDGRPVVNVYHFLRRRLHPNNRGETWSRAEDEELKRLHLLHGPHWEKIGREMGRFHVACRDRFRKIQSAYARGTWTEEEMAALKDAHAMASRGDKPEGVASWTFISQRVGTRSAPQCQWKWTEHMLFPYGASRNDRRTEWDLTRDRILVTAIYDLGIEHQSEISWSQLLQETEGLQGRMYTPGRLRIRWAALCKRVKNAGQMAIDDVCDLLMRDLAPLSPDMVNSESDSDRER